MVPRKPGRRTIPSRPKGYSARCHFPTAAVPERTCLFLNSFRNQNALFPNPRTPSKREIALSPLSPESSSHPALGRRARARSAPAPREYTPSVAFFGSRLTLNSSYGVRKQHTRSCLLLSCLQDRLAFPCLPWGV